MSIQPDFETFKARFDDRKTQLLWQWIPADMETPVSAYLKLCEDKPYSFLLESVEGGATLGRYSAIGLAPDLVWTCCASEKEEHEDADPLKTLRCHVRDSRIDIVPEDIPPMGPSGLFGYMGYDMVRLIEDIPDRNPDELHVPDSIMMRPTLMVIFDNVKNMMCLVTPVRDHAGNAKDKVEDVYTAASERLAKAFKTLTGPLPAEALHCGTRLETPLPVRSNMEEKQFHEMVERAVEYIRAGDIFQVDFDLPGFELYRSLRRLNPSPFLFYIRFEDFDLVGSSPEILVRVRDKTVTIRPIAGTRPRGRNAAEDKALAEDLLSDPKERAEHLMLLDLGRNDVGRVAKTGSMKVTEEFVIERYSHVMHIVSNVEGTLRADRDSLDALFAGFPAGTVSGAPKVRAMEIIDELEPLRRSYYGGCIGYLDGNGELDTCIALRTALVKDGKVYVQASGGIVADSKPASEYAESCNKARAIIQAAELAVDQARGQINQKDS